MAVAPSKQDQSVNKIFPIIFYNPSMIRRPSYKQFLNQTKEVQSSINLTLHDTHSPYPPPHNGNKVRPSVPAHNWQNRYLDVVKYFPDEPRALRHTYAIQPYGRSTINDSFSKSFQMLSPARPNDQSAFSSTTTSVSFRPSYREEPKKQASKEQTLQFAKCYPPRPVDAAQQANNSFSKGLYQSKSSTRLRPVRAQEEGEAEGNYGKQQRNGRMHNNANIIQKYQDKTKNQNTPHIPRSTVHISVREDKENRGDKSIDLGKKESETAQERNEKPRPPIRSIYNQNQKKSYTPIQFRKKTSDNNEDGKSTLRQTSKSPFKKICNPPTLLNTQSTLSLHSHSSIRESYKPSYKLKPKSLSLQDFHLGKKLGEGRFGVVWLAIHKATGAVFALKKISKATIKGNFMIEQFILEVKIQSFIENAYIVKAYGIFDDEENIFLLLEYLEGGTLYNSLKAKGKGKLTEEQVATKTSMICEAVSCLHEKGIAHRDIKPQNIMITHEMCKLGDFGWATFCDQRRRTYCGTTDYVAPEIVEGQEYDMTVDLWCIGVLAYELLSGRAPFYHISRQQTFNKIKNVDVSTLNYPDYFTPDASDFIGRLIKKNPKERMDMQVALRHPFLTKYHF